LKDTHTLYENDEPRPTIYDRSFDLLHEKAYPIYASHTQSSSHYVGNRDVAFPQETGHGEYESRASVSQVRTSRKSSFHQKGLSGADEKVILLVTEMNWAVGRVSHEKTK
jgi:hypothetical protein